MSTPLKNKKPSDYFQLKGHQRAVKQELENFLTEPGPNNVLGIVGPRGFGKSSIVLKAKACESHQKNKELMFTELIDATKVRRGTGLMSTCMHAIWKRGSKELPPNDQGARDQLLKDFEPCAKYALFQETSNRELASEMAMSMDHYHHMVWDWSQKEDEAYNQIQTFTKHICELFRAKRGQGCPTPRIYIFIDDLDLADQTVLENWTRSFTKIFSDKNEQKPDNLYWVLCFDAEHLKEKLGRALNGNNPNTVFGESYLSKLIPRERQARISTWPLEDRKTFKPYDIEEKELQALYQHIQFFTCELLLPNNPRSLKNLYFWLKKNSDSQDPYHKTVTRCMYVLSELNGYSDLLGRLNLETIPSIATTFGWDGDDQIFQAITWQALVQNAKNNQLLYNLPIPTSFDRGNAHLFALIELQINICFEMSRLKPFELLFRMPFTITRINKCRGQCQFRTADLSHFFDPSNDVIGWFLFWGTWSESPNSEDGWTFTLGPQSLVEAYFGHRKLLPARLLEYVGKNTPEMLVKLQEPYQIHKRQQAAESLRQQDQTNPPSLFPGNFRALLLLLDAFEQIPWEGLANFKTHWNPFTVTQVYAGYMLSAYASCILGDQPQGLDSTEVAISPPLFPGTDPKEKDKKISLFFPHCHYSQILRASAGEIDQAFGALLVWLVGLPEVEKPHDPLSSAKQELQKSLRYFLDTPMVKKLRQTTSGPADKQAP